MAPFGKGSSSEASLSDYQSSQTLNVISFNLSLRSTFPSYFFLSPQVCISSSIPVPLWADFFYLNGPRVFTTEKTFVGEEKLFFSLSWVLSWDPCNKREINERKTEVYYHAYIMYTWEIAREKWVTPWGNLEFRLKFYLHSERGEGMQAS